MVKRAKDAPKPLPIDPQKVEAAYLEGIAMSSTGVAPKDIAPELGSKKLDEALAKLQKANDFSTGEIEEYRRHAVDTVKRCQPRTAASPMGLLHGAGITTTQFEARNTAVYQSGLLLAVAGAIEEMANAQLHNRRFRGFRPSAFSDVIARIEEEIQGAINTRNSIHSKGPREFKRDRELDRSGRPKE